MQSFNFSSKLGEAYILILVSSISEILLVKFMWIFSCDIPETWLLSVICSPPGIFFFHHIFNLYQWHIIILHQTLCNTYHGFFKNWLCNQELALKNRKLNMVLNRNMLNLHKSCQWHILQYICKVMWCINVHFETSLKNAYIFSWQRLRKCTLFYLIIDTFHV